MRIVCGFILLAFSPFWASGLQSEATVDSGSLQAIEAAQKSVRESPDLESARLSLATLYLKAGRNQDAVQVLQPYLQSHPDSSKVIQILAVAFLRKEDYQAASESAERALHLGPRDSAGVQVLAMAQLGLQDTDTAERLFLEALQLDPSSVEANFQLGLLYTKQHKNLSEAVHLLQRARALQPNLTGIDSALGSALLASGHARDAATSLETAVNLTPNDAQSYYLLASAYRQLHQDDKAAAALNAFNVHMKADGEQRAREMRGQADYQTGVNLLSDSNELDKAYAALTKAVAELPAFDPAYYRIAQVSYLQNNMPQALSSIRQAILLDPFEPEYYFVLARCLEESDPRAALEAINTAARLRPGVQDFEGLQRELKTKAGVKPVQ